MIPNGLSLDESERLCQCLDRLMPFVRPDGVAVTGGVGMQLGLADLGRQGPRDHVADLDLVVASGEAVRSEVLAALLLSHYHVVCPGVPKFMIQLVDPESRIRIDIFPDLVGSLASARRMAIGRHSIPVLPLERIFEHKVQTLLRSSESTPIDPKHRDDARLLGAVLGRPVPDVAVEALTPDVYGMEANYHCGRCELSHHPGWPLAPRERIFELLGWDAVGPTPFAADGAAERLGSFSEETLRRANP